MATPFATKEVVVAFVVVKFVEFNDVTFIELLAVIESTVKEGTLIEFEQRSIGTAIEVVVLRIETVAFVAVKESTVQEGTEIDDETFKIGTVIEELAIIVFVLISLNSESDEDVGNSQLKPPEPLFVNTCDAAEACTTGSVKE